MVGAKNGNLTWKVEKFTCDVKVYSFYIFMMLEFCMIL